MTGEPIITLIGNLTADPVIRFTQRGDAVANFTVASTPRTFDRTTNQWRDGEALFMNCVAWRNLAQNISDSLTKGTRVIVSGKMKSNSYQDREGNNRRSIEIEVEEVGPSLRYATTVVNRISGRSSGGFNDSYSSGGGNWDQQSAGGDQPNQSSDDGNSWQPSQDESFNRTNPDPWANAQSSEPPF